MGTPFATTAPSNLYAFLLRLRPLQPGTLMAFSGELVHGAWMHSLGEVAPDVAKWLHNDNKLRLFTCSSLQFPLSRQRMLEVECENVHLPLDPDKTYTVRITLLRGELFPLCYDMLTRLTATKKSPAMQIGKQLFSLDEVLIENGDPSGWTGFTSLNTLIEKAKALHSGSTESLKLEFASLTTFSRGNAKNKMYGNHYARVPLPAYVFPNLAKRWQELAPPELVNIVQMERIEQYALDEGIVIADYDLKPHTMKFTTHWQEGFVGMCTYHLRGPNEPTTGDAPLTLKQQIMLLGQLAFYCGVGYKTAMGMGQTRKV